VRRADNLATLKYGSLNLLETSGPVKACNGIALLLLYSDRFLPPSGNFSLFQIEIISIWLSQQIVLLPALINCAGI
jgi:hypothetical protein